MLMAAVFNAVGGKVEPKDMMPYYHPPEQTPAEMLANLRAALGR